MTDSAGRVMVIDALMAGVSGDMMVGALIDLGADENRVIRAMEMPCKYLAGCQRLKVDVKDVSKKGFHAKKVDVIAEEDYDERSSDELVEAATRSLKALKATEAVKKFVLKCFDSLISAESIVHGQGDSHHVHLHEMASVDTIADFIGTAIALDDLEIFNNTKVYSTAVAIGGGLFKFSHGRVSSPAPATLEILRANQFPLTGGQVEAELATPTGAAILTNLAHETIRFYPGMKPFAVGYGAGTKEFTEMPNVLRVTLGESCTSLLSDQIYVLETNLDDTTGEVIGHTIDRLLYEGAKDVSVTPLLTKKSRPAQLIKVITDRTGVEKLSRILLEETGTIGVRFYLCERLILNREPIPAKIVIGGCKKIVNIKVSRDTAGKVLQVKPDYEDISKIAKATGQSFREISRQVMDEVGKLYYQGTKNDQ
ncbi:nickel pincer cofactor biosynthesis protein LarC [Chloroflexota bacterium]